LGAPIDERLRPRHDYADAGRDVRATDLFRPTFKGPRGAARAHGLQLVAKLFIHVGQTDIVEGTPTGVEANGPIQGPYSGRILRRVRSATGDYQQGRRAQHCPPETLDPILALGCV